MAGHTCMTVCVCICLCVAGCLPICMISVCLISVVTFSASWDGGEISASYEIGLPEEAAEMNNGPDLTGVTIGWWNGPCSGRGGEYNCFSESVMSRLG